MEASVKANTSTPVILSQKQRRIIDLAHKIDPSYAASLAELLDNDPARANNHRDLKHHLQLLDTKKKLAEQSPQDIDPNSSKLDYSRAAWMNLGALNANRIQTFHVKFIRNYTEAASNYNFEKAYPIFSWVIENSVKRFADNNQEKRHLTYLYENAVLGAELAWRVAARSQEYLSKLKTQPSKLDLNSGLFVFRSGDRDKALKFIREWLENEVEEYLKICDPYFGIDDLEILKLILSAKPACSVSILTSRKHQKKFEPKLEEAYCNQWRVRFSDQDPPDTEIVIVGTEPGGDSPIHDRWWLTKGSGLRVGTSFNSLGVAKSSEVSILSVSESLSLEAEIDQYLLFPGKRDYGGTKLRYLRFTLL